MKSVLNAVNVVVGLSVAALALGGLAAPAMAQDVRIPVGDLNLNTAQGRAQFDVRVKEAAERTCPGIRELARHDACVRTFREAADENLSDQMTRLARQQDASFASARR